MTAATSPTLLLAPGKYSYLLRVTPTLHHSRLYSGCLDVLSVFIISGLIADLKLSTPSTLPGINSLVGAAYLVNPCILCGMLQLEAITDLY